MPGNAFQLFNGVLQNTFATVNLPTLVPGLFWNQSHLYSSGTLSVGGVLGDLNTDGIVNGQDISLAAAYWLHTGTNIPGDDNGDGIVNGQDISIIASHWLQTAVPGSATSVPEPSTWVLVVVGLLLGVARRQFSA